MKRFKTISIVLLLFFPIVTKTFIYELAVLRRWNGPLGRYQYFIGLSDFHDKTNKANKVQVRDLISMLESCPTATTKIGSEDISSPGGASKARCGRFIVRSRGGVLGGISKKCRDLGFAVQNFEYRYCRVAALGPVLNNLNTSMKRFSSVRDTKVQSLITEIESALNELSSYNDGPELSVVYQHCITKIRAHMRALRMYEFAHASVADYLAAVTDKNNRLPFLKKLLTFDSVVLDLKMLHSVINSRDHLNFLAIAGGSHIGRVTQLLAKLGYEPVHKAKTTFVRDYNVRRCLGGNIIDGRYCRKPRPIDIRVIKDFL